MPLLCLLVKPKAMEGFLTALFFMILIVFFRNTMRPFYFPLRGEKYRVVWEYQTRD